jgi:ABC-type thiamine transport system ATPase subunit
MYKLTYAGNLSKGFPSVDAVFRERNVILGANGTGKSQLLRLIRDSYLTAFGPNRIVIYVEGGRAVQLPEEVRTVSITVQQDASSIELFERYRGKRSGPIVGRVTEALMWLRRRGEEEKHAHSDQVTEWVNSGKQGDLPERGEPPLDRLFRLFNAVFPSIKIEHDHPKIFATKEGGRYSITGLSDGEKQVFAILADLASIPESNPVVLVDEPELNLHPSLALQLWSVVEQELPKATFLYATHSVAFAMRSEIDLRLILGQSGSLIVDDIVDLPESELRAFLGAIPAITRTAQALVTEGKDSSIDPVFYKWIAGREDLSVVPIGGCEEVLSAVQRTGLWKRLSPAVKIAGVVDRDFKTEGELRRNEEGGCFVLPYHEAESYLCHPDLLVSLLSKTGLAASPPSHSDLAELILEYAQRNLNHIALLKTAEISRTSLDASIPNKVLEKCKTVDSLIAAIRQVSTHAMQSASERFNPDSIEKIFRDEMNQLKRLGATDIDALLRILPGKGLVAHLLQRIQIKDLPQLARLTIFHLDPNDFEHTRNLRISIEKKLVESQGKVPALASAER